MKKLPIRGRTLALFSILVPLLLLFIYTGLRSGPLAPVAVTVATVSAKEIRPALFGIGTVEARYSYKIGPITAGHIKSVDVHVGDVVRAGQIIGEMEPIDLDDKMRSLDATLKRAEAMVTEAKARQSYAQIQAQRYEKLAAGKATSQENAVTKMHELQIANAALAVAQEEVTRIESDRAGLKAQRHNLRLIAPTDGIVSLRNANPGSIIVAGQSIVEIIDPKSLWVNVRFDQSSATGLAAKLPAQIVLRSRKDQPLAGQVLRIEPKADAVTEELLAKVIFNDIPDPLPPLGELTEVTVTLAAVEATPVISNSSIRSYEGKMGVWKVRDGDTVFTPIKLGASDLDGLVQVHEGVEVGDQVVLYSEKALGANSRIKVVDHIKEVAP